VVSVSGQVLDDVDDVEVEELDDDLMYISPAASVVPRRRDTHLGRVSPIVLFPQEN
jgi:hypothetical protein